MSSQEFEDWLRGKFVKPTPPPQVPRVDEDPERQVLFDRCRIWCDKYLGNCIAK